ncbi:MAG: hypothetical protein FJW39_28355 [Acidobacteria bacterium]|nr:hypothetical protein [Acidobacteriota bacterium]
MAATTMVNAANPWPGLLPFSEADRDFFRGRRNEADELLRLVLRERVAVLFGLSGLGKSSLLQAGLFPALRNENIFPVYIRLDYSQGAPDLAAQVRDAIAREAATAEIEPPAATPGETLWEYLHRQDSDFWNRRNRPVLPLLVFDQFEELFTLGQSDPARSDAFLMELSALAEGHPPAQVEARLNRHPDQAEQFQFTRHNYKILLTVREDFLPELEDLRPRVSAVAVNRMRLLRMNSDAARQVVNQVPHLIDPDVGERVVRFVSAAKSEVEPALLSVVCRELNSKRQERGDAKITADLLEGSQTEVLSDFYERSISDLPHEVREFVEESLLTVSGYRDSVALENALSKRGVTRAALDLLIDRRLIRIDDDAGERIELTHDLLTGVVRSSRDRRREQEDKRREASARLEAEERERQRRAVLEVRRTRIIAAAFFGLALIAILAAWLAYRAGKEAQRQETLARQEADRARKAEADAQRSASEANSARDAAKQSEKKARDEQANAMREKENAIAQQSRAVKAASKEKEARKRADENAALAEKREKEAQSESERAGREQKKAEDARVEANLQTKIARESQEKEQALRLQPPATSLKRTWSKPAASWNVIVATRHSCIWRALRNDPTSLAAKSFASDLLIRKDPAQPGPVPGRAGPVITIPRHPERILSLAVSSNGQFLVTGAWDKIARTWNLANGSLIRELKGHCGLINSVAISSDNRWIATGSHDTTARLWNAATGELVREFKGHTQPVHSVSFSADGQLLATASSDRTARIWAVATGAAQTTLSHDAPVSSARFDPAGRRLVTASWNNRATVWSLSAGKPTVTLDHQAQVNYAVFSPDGRRVVTASEDGRAQVWEENRPIGAALRHPGPVNHAAFSPDGRRVITASDDSTARVWEADTGAPISVPLPHNRQRVSAAVFAPDGLRVITAGYDNEVRLWEVRYDWDDAALLADWVEAESGYQAARLPDLVQLASPATVRERIRNSASPTAAFLRWCL